MTADDTFKEFEFSTESFGADTKAVFQKISGKVDGIQAMFDEMKKMMEPVMSASKKINEYPYPPAPDPNAAQMSKEFEAAKAKIAELETAAKDFEAAKKAAKDFEAAATAANAEKETLAKKVADFEAAEKNNKVNALVEAQFSKGLIKEEDKIVQAKNFSAMTSEQIDGLMAATAKMKDFTAATPAADVAHAEKGTEPGQKDFAEKTAKIATLKEQRAAFIEAELKTDKLDAEIKALEA
jgi:hypothetical protein